MKDSNNVVSQTADAIAHQVERNLMGWLSRHISVTSDATAAQINEIAIAYRPAFWNQIAPQVVTSLIQSYEEALAVLRDCQRRMNKAQSIMEFFIGPSPKVPAAMAKPAAVAPKEVVRALQPIEINLRPQINVGSPSTKSIQFKRDERGSITSAEVTKS